MRIIARRTLREFWETHRDAEEPLIAWYRRVKREYWDTPAEVRFRYPKASVVGNDRVVFNIKGNAYRLVVRVDYWRQVVYIRFIGTHREYDRINAREV